MISWLILFSSSISTFRCRSSDVRIQGSRDLSEYHVLHCFHKMTAVRGCVDVVAPFAPKRLVIGSPAAPSLFECCAEKPLVGIWQQPWFPRVGGTNFILTTSLFDCRYSLQGIYYCTRRWELKSQLFIKA